MAAWQAGKFGPIGATRNEGRRATFRLPEAIASLSDVFDFKSNGRRHAILVSFRGELAEEDFARLDALGKEHKGGDPYDCIFDLTAVEKVGIAVDFVAKRGDLPQVFADRQRIYVVPQEDLKLLVRLYAAYQDKRGWRPPAIVEKLEDAFAMLNIHAADFDAG